MLNQILCDPQNFKIFMIGSGNGLLPDGTKPLAESMLTYRKYTQVTLI